MYILDTDHLSVLDRGGSASQSLYKRLSAAGSREEIVTSIISYEEQTRGWLARIKKAETLQKEIDSYKQFNRLLTTYCKTRVLDFDREAAREFELLRKLYRRVGRYYGIEDCIDSTCK